MAHENTALFHLNIVWKLKWAWDQSKSNKIVKYLDTPTEGQQITRIYFRWLRITAPKLTNEFSFTYRRSGDTDLCQIAADLTLNARQGCV